VRFKNEIFIYHASLTLQWTPLLPVGSIFERENTHSVALGLVNTRSAVQSPVKAVLTVRKASTSLSIQLLGNRRSLDMEFIIQTGYKAWI